jgi:hypothetical protein
MDTSDATRRNGVGGEADAADVELGALCHDRPGECTSSYGTHLLAKFVQLGEHRLERKSSGCSLGTGSEDPSAHSA